MTWRSHAAHIGLAGALFACGTDSKPGVAEPEPGPLGYEPCPPESDLGDFAVELDAEYTSVEGKFLGGIVPEQVWAELAAAGACRLLVPPQLNCDPPCKPPINTCSNAISCTPLPDGIDFGTVRVRGLVAPVEMTPGAATKNYFRTPPLTHPGFAPGANITLSATGGNYAPFALPGWGISLFTLTNDEIRVEPGTALSLSWELPADPGPAHVFASLNVNHHGSSKGAIECDFPDTGSAEIPAVLIDGLMARGASGFPTLEVTRRTASSTTIEPGCVEFLIKTFVALDVTVPGITSCNSNRPCPEGQTCRDVELFCE